jgi:hypothetical protein
MSEGPRNRRIPVSLIAVPFTLFWTCVMLVIAFFVMGTSYRPYGMLAGFAAIIASGAYIAYRTGGLKRRSDSAP